MKRRVAASGLLIGLITWLLTSFAAAATIAPPKKTSSKSHKVTESASTQKKMARSKHSTRSSAKASSTKVTYTKNAKKGVKKSRYYERFYASSFASDQAFGDTSAGEDPIVRAAAIEALGNMNGTV